MFFRYFGESGLKYRSKGRAMVRDMSFQKPVPQLGNTMGMRWGQHMFTIIHNASISSACNSVENKPDIFHMQTKTFLESLGPRRRFTGRGAASPGWLKWKLQWALLHSRPCHCTSPLSPAPRPPVPKPGLASHLWLNTGPSNATWQLWFVPLGRTWHLMFAFVVLCASSAPAWAGALGVPDVRPMAVLVSRQRNFPRCVNWNFTMHFS